MHKSIIAAAIAVVGFNSAAIADGLTVGVSWSNFQEERWKTCLLYTSPSPRDS